MPKSVVNEVKASYEDYERPHGSHHEKVKECRREFAALINADSREISFQPNSSTSFNLIVKMLDPGRGDNVVVDDLGFPSTIFPLLALRKKGLDVRWVRNKGGLITSEDYVSVIDSNTKLVVVSSVSWINGLRAEVAEIGKLAKENGSYYAIDGTQSTGYLETDVEEWRADFLVTSNYKWLLSPFGASEFYCSRRVMKEFEPPLLGWHSVFSTQEDTTEDKYELLESAEKYEPGSLDCGSIFAFLKSLRFLKRLGVNRTGKKTVKLAKYLADDLIKAGLKVLTPVEDDHISGLVYACMEGVDGSKLMSSLKKQSIHVIGRDYHGYSGIRISPYFYNSEQDVEKLVSAVKRIKQRNPST
jgi:selenocysteine lyase/cysteine desulfurase